RNRCDQASHRAEPAGERRPRRSLQVGGAGQHHRVHVHGHAGRVDRHHRPAGHLPRYPPGPAAPGSISYLLWMIMGYRLVQAVLVVTVGRLGDMFGRVRIYNSGFVVFTVASILLSFDPFTGGHGALWLIGGRLLQAVGGSMLMASSAAILTDAFPAEQRGFALGTNQVAGLAGMFVGLVAGGLLAAIDWRWVFWVNVPVGVYGTIWAYLQLRDNGERHPACIDWWGNITFAVGLSAVLIAVTYGIQPHGGHTMGWTSPWVLAGLAGGSALLAAFVILETRIEAPMFQLSLFRIRAFTAGNLAGLAVAIARGGLQFMLIICCRASGCRCMATTTARPRCGRASSCFPSPPGSWSRGRSRASCPTSSVLAASRPLGWR